METLLGSEGSAPPTLVDGAVAGLGAVLGEMHKEGLFSAASAAGVSKLPHSSMPKPAKTEGVILFVTEMPGPRRRVGDHFRKPLLVARGVA